MGRMKDLDIDRLNAVSTEEVFIRFLAELFSAKNYVVVETPERGPDLSVRSGDDAFVTLVELKVHRSKRIAERAVQNALLQMKGMLDATAATEGIIVFTQPIDARYLTDLPPRVTVWDLDELVRQTRSFPNLATELAELLRVLMVGAERPPEEAGRRTTTAVAELLEDDDVASPDPRAGAAIVAELDALVAGKADATAFEKVCQRALELMFGNDFAGWRPQNMVDAGERLPHPVRRFRIQELHPRDQPGADIHHREVPVRRCPPIGRTRRRAQWRQRERHEGDTRIAARAGEADPSGQPQRVPRDAT